MDTDIDNMDYQHMSGSDHEMHQSGNVFTMTMAHFHPLVDNGGFSDEMVHDAIHGACEFLNMNDLDVVPAENMGVYTNDPITLNDDVLGFSKEQMQEMGVNDENTLSLICTHEAAHCMLQYLSSTHQLSNWQEELSCDAFMGVRAAVEGLDTSKVEHTLSDTQSSVTHPHGELRVHYVEIGKQIGEDLKDHDIPVTPENVMTRLNDYFKDEAESIFKQEAIVNEYTGKNQTPEYPDDQKNYTQEEINRHISDAKLEIARQESNMRINQSIIESKKASGNSFYSEKSNYESAQRRYDEAKDALWKWEHTQPDPQKGFVEEQSSSVDSDTFHSYSSDVSNAMSKVDSCQSRVDSLYSKLQYTKLKYGTDSGEYKQAKREFDEAQSDLSEAREDYKRAVQDAHRMGTL